MEKGKAYLQISYQNNYNEKNVNLFTIHYKGWKMKHNVIYTKGETYLQIFCENNLDNCDWKTAIYNSITNTREKFYLQ